MDDVNRIMLSAPPPLHFGLPDLNGEIGRIDGGEGDLEMFGAAMEDFQKLGFKVFALRAQTQLLYDCLEFLKGKGGVGADMSGWGPALCAFGEDLSELRQKTEERLASHGGGKTVPTKANNRGMRLLEEA